LKSQVERNRSVLVLLLFGYKGTRTEWLQLGNILLRSGTILLQKINRTEPLRSHPALTVTLRSIHSATKQKIEPLRYRLLNTEQSGSVSRIKDRTALFYLLLNQTLPRAAEIGNLGDAEQKLWLRIKERKLRLSSKFLIPRYLFPPP
jgi:hypothetical protein